MVLYVMGSQYIQNNPSIKTNKSTIVVVNRVTALYGGTPQINKRNLIN